MLMSVMVLSLLTSISMFVSLARFVGACRFANFGKCLLQGRNVGFVGIVGHCHRLCFYVKHQVFHTVLSSLSKGMFFRILSQQSWQCKWTYNTTCCLFGFASAVLKQNAIGIIAKRKIIIRFI